MQEKIIKKKEINGQPVIGSPNFCNQVCGCPHTKSSGCPGTLCFKAT